MKATGLKATNVCQDDELCAGLKAKIYRDIHGIQVIWDNNLSTEYRYFYLLMPLINDSGWNDVDDSTFMVTRSLFCI